MEVVQTLLHQKKEQSIHAQVAWLPADPRVKKGSVITLKDNLESGEWRVAELYVTRQQSEEIEHRKWGLDLPKSQRTER